MIYRFLILTLDLLGHVPSVAVAEVDFHFLSDLQVGEAFQAVVVGYSTGENSSRITS